jgi:hypothetical protein
VPFEQAEADTHLTNDIPVTFDEGKKRKAPLATFLGGLSFYSLYQSEFSEFPKSSLGIPLNEKSHPLALSLNSYPLSYKQ